ncbi:cell division protein FtsX [Natronincola peptidivorans]|uniref:Cell division protein FtsX n=1 Tax=Natronincola peptidivorans TaxID=426128 RepID=A0A1I0CCK4_9FIRM|nr:permease-like cell division protein FtsX [Natronincola peptidivorans]SET17142.1 cell division protein FtsX [Natronincola peptidivorans]
MKNILYNTGYFLKEAKTMLRLSLLSNIFSLISTGLIFFILAMVISGWLISSEVVEVIQGEAEINVYFDEDIDNTGAVQLVERINDMDGVREARVVDEEEAYQRMVEILGKEARVLEFFDDNPFNAFIEVKIHLEKIEPVLERLHLMAGIEHVRDNREVLDRLQSIAELSKLLGYLIITAVGISTLVIISHIIRQGIFNNREQINTLRLLGAPENFIALPFLLEGLLLTLGGGLLASILSVFTLKQVYAQMTGPLPFIPLPPRETLVPGLVILVMSLSGILGIIGSLLGLSSAKSK